MSKFNPIAHLQQLQDAGVSEKEARIQTQGLLSIMDAEFATKDDLKCFATKDDLKHLEQHLNNKINMVEAVLSSKITTVDTKLNWLMTLIGAIGIVLALLNFFHIH